MTTDIESACICGNPKTHDPHDDPAHVIRMRLAEIRATRIALAEEEQLLQDRLAKIAFAT